MDEKELQNHKFKKLLKKQKYIGVLLGYGLNSLFMYLIAYNYEITNEPFLNQMKFMSFTPIFLYWIFNGRFKQDLKDFGLDNLETPKINDSERYPDLYKLEKRLGEKLR